LRGVPRLCGGILLCGAGGGKTLQPRLVLDCALIDVATIEPLVPLGDLIDRLGALERAAARTGSGGGTKPAPISKPAPAPAPPAPRLAEARGPRPEAPP